MDINNIQALIAQGLITDVASVDPNTAYVAVGVFQPGNRQSGPAGNAYPSYAMPISEFLVSSGLLTGAQNGLSLVGTVVELGGSLLHTTDININGQSLLFKNGLYPILFLDPGKQQVAIGGNNPTAMLDITAVGSGTVGLRLNTASTQDAVLRFGTNNNTYGGLGFRAKIWVEDATQTLNFYTNNNDTIFWNGNGGGVQTKTFTLFTDTTAKFENNIGIGADPVTNGRVQINNTVFGKASISLGGADYYGIDVNTTGLSMLLGVNTGNNKQLWLADQDKLASNGTNPVLQFGLFGTSPSAINAISTNGSYLDLVLQSNGGNVGISTGVINPTARLHVKGNSAPGDFTFKAEDAGGNLLLCVRNDGNIGVGTANPLSKLYVNSSIQNEQIVLNNDDITGSSYFGLAQSGGIKAGMILLNSNHPFIPKTLIVRNLWDNGSIRINGGSGDTNIMYFDTTTFNVGIGTTTPNASALLDLTSTTGSLLVPRMTTAQKNALTPANGMIVYDSTLDKFQGYEAGAWANLI